MSGKPIRLPFSSPVTLYRSAVLLRRCTKARRVTAGDEPNCTLRFLYANFRCLFELTFKHHYFPKYGSRM